MLKTQGGRAYWSSPTIHDLKKNGEGAMPTAEQYREAAEESRVAALRKRSPDIRVQLLDLAEPYERMATRVEGRVSSGTAPSGGLRDTTSRGVD